MVEAWITAVTYSKGRRVGAKRFELRVPLDVATGRYERLTNLGLRETLKDLSAEQARRESGTPPEPTAPEAPGLTPTKKFDPFASQIKGTQ